MDVGSNKRTISKLKGYIDLAMEEINKAVRADECGLIDDAVSYYRNSHRILVEGASTCVPSCFSFSEQQKVNAYRHEISKWQGRVSDRLQALSPRAGQTLMNKVIPTVIHTFIQKFLNYVLWIFCLITASRPQRAQVSSITTVVVKDVKRRPPTLTRSSSLVNNRSNKSTGSKSQEASGGSDAQLTEMINTVIVDRSPSVKWDDVAGLELAKQTLNEMVILPMKRRDLFVGLRRPPRGLLLFGPPGNGKTMLAKAVASECNATFFNVSASTLTSKWVGEGEKLVRTLFMVAISRQPSVIFMDEIDSMLSAREANENDASRRLKSEFLVQFDGVTSDASDLVIVIGATNRPQELDDAVLRRLVKRIYVPLPDDNVRKLVLKQHLKGHAFSLPRHDLERLSRETEGYSGSDLQALCEEAAMMPIRELGPNILTVKANQVRPLSYEDLQKAMTIIRPSLRRSRWEELERWNQQFGSN